MDKADVRDVLDNGVGVRDEDELGVWLVGGGVALWIRREVEATILIISRALDFEARPRRGIVDGRVTILRGVDLAIRAIWTYSTWIVKVWNCLK